MFDFNAWFTALVATLAFGVAGWVISLIKRDVSIVDSMWCRLAAHITWRNLGEEEDYRYRRMRRNNSPRFELKSPLPDRTAEGAFFQLSTYRLHIMILLVAFAAVPVLAVPQSSGDDADVYEWNFEVYLGDSKVGYHHFRLEQEDGQRKLVSEADFEVKLLFLTLYRYRHVNTETWEGDCLEEIESRTNENGKQFTVRGSQGPDAFEVRATGLHKEVPGCVKTFAYWNRDFLQDSVLMNPQTGKLLPVIFEPLETEPFVVRGEEVVAKRYRLQADGMNLELWYSQDDEWLGLQSTTENGRTIHYKLT